LRHLEIRLKQSSVDATLKRGFTLVRDASGKPVMDGQSLETGEAISIQFRDGDVGAQVKK
jgi:exodeoxyribonuclease VII large subunit